MARVRTNSRVIAIILAVVLALVAAYALFSYLQGVETRTQEEFQAVDTFVATEEISAGTTAEAAVDAGLIEERAVPGAGVPPNAVESLEQIQGTVATVDILPGEVLVVDRFGATAEAQRGLRQIPQDKEAISVQVGVVQGVAGFISPGDQVSVIAELTFPETDEEVEVEDEEAPPVEEGIVVQYLLQDIEVLAVGRRVIQEGEDQVQQTEQVLMTLALDPEEAEQLVFAYNNGFLHFTLLPPESDDPDEPGLDRPIETPGRSLSNIFDD